MLNSVAVEVAVGLALVFFLVATVATGVNQVLSRWTDARAKTLWRALAGLLEPAGNPPSGTPANLAAAASGALPTGVDIGTATALSFGFGRNDSRPTGAGTANLVEDLLAVPSIRDLDPVKGFGKPTKVEDIPPRVFAVALLELAKIKGSPDNDSVEDKIKHLASQYPDSPLSTFLSSIAAGIGSDLDTYLDTTAEWFDGHMTRLSQIYRKNTRWILLIIGVIAAFFFNVDAIEIGHTLRDDSDLRAGVLVIADNVDDGFTDDCKAAEENPNGEDLELKCARELLRELNGLKLPVLGDWTWDTWKSSWSDGFLAHLVGLLVSAGAISLGAPFWYDALRWLSGFRRRS